MRGHPLFRRDHRRAQGDHAFERRLQRSRPADRHPGTDSTGRHHPLHPPHVPRLRPGSMRAHLPYRGREVRPRPALHSGERGGAHQIRAAAIHGRRADPLRGARPRQDDALREFGLSQAGLRRRRQAAAERQGAVRGAGSRAGRHGAAPRRLRPHRERHRLHRDAQKLRPSGKRRHTLPGHARQNRFARHPRGGGAGHGGRALRLRPHPHARVLEQPR